MFFNDKTLNFMIILWLLSLIILGVVNEYVDRDIEQQRIDRR